MRTATNQVGFDIQKLTPYGWKVAGFGKPHAAREAADTALEKFIAAAPAQEFRVYPALESK